MTTIQKISRDEMVAAFAALAKGGKGAVEFTLGETVVGCLAADDETVRADAYPSLTKMKGYLYAATRADAGKILGELIERAEPGENGYGHTKSERHAILQCARRLLPVLAAAAPVAAAKTKGTRKAA